MPSYMSMWYLWSMYAIVMDIMAHEAASAGKLADECFCLVARERGVIEIGEA